MGLDGFFYPKSIAVAGASRTAGKAGNTVIRNILEFGYSGTVYPVNPGASEILGLKAYPSLSALDVVPDLVIAVLPRHQAQGLMEECTRVGVRNVIVPAAGFSDAGAEGRDLEERLMSVARAAGITVMGPNSIGTICTGAGLATSIVGVEALRSGGVSLFGQSGMFASGFASWIETEEYFGVAKVACLGNKAGLDESDLLDYLGSDPESRVIATYTEGVSDGRRFAGVLGRVAAEKPVLVLKSGRTSRGVEAISSHTGSMAGEDLIFTGMLKQAGAIRVADTEEMFDLAKAFEFCPLPNGGGLGVVSVTGLGCVLSADSAGDHGLELPAPSRAALEGMREALPEWAPAKNPADVWAAIESRGAEVGYGSATRALIDDTAVHSLIIIFTLIPESDMDAMSLFFSLRERQPAKPIMAVLMAGDASMRADWKRSLETAGIPTYPTPERAVRAVAAMWRYAACVARTRM